MGARVSLDHARGLEELFRWLMVATRSRYRDRIAPALDGLLNVAAEAVACLRVHLVHHLGPEPLEIFTRPSQYVRYPVWAPGRTRIVFERGEVTGRIWSVEIPSSS